MLFLMVLVPFVLLIEARGPHHPRGEPVVRKHVHYRPSKEAPEKLTQDSQLLHDKEHLQEHLEGIINEPDFSKMSDDELEFYYFQVHDIDKNNKLDGLEIFQAIIHTTEHDDDHALATEDNADNQQENFEPVMVDFDYFVDVIDRVLELDDIDNDGYLNYIEYSAGKKKEKEKYIAVRPEVKLVT